MRRPKEYKIIVVGGPALEWNQSEEGFEAFYNILISAAKLKAAKLKAKAERKAKRESGHQQKNSILRRGVIGRDSDALLHCDTKTAKPTRARKGGHRMRGRLKLPVEATAENTGNTPRDKELIQI